ncbi:pentapeptide repeat-containing protein [Cystobacter ferrugineus]|uniref:Pentapeptide repeat-containing protein n=1 Tax=Cystobacter ferrugineus TaxID=83449 RepID=A0A1L9B2V8_9BACT|nr:pentapeptide repeat-containing protein [Cystobacter ferrugineus]OJH36589.1 hypothetical protein BON30_33070 [Cystobacter ferrugineus]
MGWLENIVFRDREIENERLELTDKGSLYFVGPNLTLTNCTLVLKVPARNLALQGVRFVNCTFEVKQELKKKQQWVLASLKGCRFKGNLSDCDFGHWPGYAPGWEHGSIEDCDFSEARLDGCRIMGCDPSTVRFPKWPCFTILDPVRNSRALRSATWPGRFGRIVIDDLANYPAGTRALTFYAPFQAKHFDITPEALQAVLQQFDCILF